MALLRRAVLERVPREAKVMNVGEIMNGHVISVDLDDTVAIIRNLFHQHNFHHLLVTDKRFPAGVISDRDLLRNLSPFIGSVFGERSQDLDLLQRRAHQIMTHRPITASPYTPIEEAARTMLRETISCLPIVDAERRPVGIVTARDLLRILVNLAKQPAISAAPA
jgi:acetoin utilization protein AcuB